MVLDDGSFLEEYGFSRLFFLRGWGFGDGRVGCLRLIERLFWRCMFLFVRGLKWGRAWVWVVLAFCFDILGIGLFGCG